MADETKIVGLKITTDTGDSVKGVKNLEDASGSLLSGLTNLEGGLGLATKALGALAAGFAALEIGKYVEEATMLAARVETLGAVMNTVGINAGYSSREMEGFSKAVAAQGITTEASRQATIRMAQAHVDLTKSSELARIAQDAAVIAQTNSSDAFERMTTGIATGQAIILHHMGLMVNFEKSYKDLSVTLGKSKEDLTENEKTQARVNEVMAAGTGIAGSYESAMGTAGKQVTSLSRYFEEIKLAVGEPFTETFSLILMDVNRSLKDLLGTMKDNKSGMVEFGHDVADAYRFMKNEARQLASALDMLGGEMTRMGAVGSKAAELLTRFVTIGQFGDGLNNSYENFRRLNKMYEERFKTNQNEIAAYNAASSVTGPTLDPREQMLLRMSKEADESKRIKNRRKEPTSEIVDDSTDVSDQAYKAYIGSLDGLNKQIRALNPDLTDMQKKFLEVDETVNRLKISQPEYTKSWAEYGIQMKKAITLEEELKGRVLTPRQQSQFDNSAMLQNWETKRQDALRQEEKEQFDHNNIMLGMQTSLTEGKLQYLGKEEEALLLHYERDREQAAAQLQWTLDHVALEESQKARLKEEYSQREIEREQTKAMALASIWERNAEKYVGFAGQMTTMGIQYLLFDEGQRDQIGKRMLATSIRFLGQGLQQFMMSKAKEHLLAAAAAAGRTTTDATAATANLTILGTQATAWAAFYSAMSLNPFGGQAFIPAATAMTAVAGGVVPAAIAGVATTGATSVAGELAMAAAWGAGGVLVGSLGEAGATSIEGGTSGSTNAAGYGAGTPGSPVITQPAGNTTNQGNLTIIVKVDGNIMSDTTWVESTLAPAIRDAAQNRNVDFGLATN